MTTLSQTTLSITGPMRPRYDEILTPEALQFLAELHHRFAGERHDRLAERMQVRYDLGNGRDLRFLPHTASIREDAPAPASRTAESRSRARATPR